ncbi:MAG: hypothetical protein ACK47M_21290, partial [Caldilinea sp.]
MLELKLFGPPEITIDGAAPTGDLLAKDLALLYYLAVTGQPHSRTSLALLLWGVASAEENPPEGKTLLVYTTPITLYQFPIAPGGSWVSTGEVKNGTVRGLAYAGKD